MQRAPLLHGPQGWPKRAPGGHHANIATGPDEGSELGHYCCLDKLLCASLTKPNGQILVRCQEEIIHVPLDHAQRSIIGTGDFLNS